MTILTNKEYSEMKFKFLNESGDWHCETSPMNSNGVYIKTYICDNGNVITEVNRPVYEQVDIKVKNVETTVSVKLLESEMFSNKFGSVYTYEKF